MQLSEDAVKRLLESWPVARLATLRRDGTPALVPVVFAASGGRLWVPVDAKPKRAGELARVAHVRRDPRVALLLDHYDADWSALWWLRVEGAGTAVEGEHAPGAAAAAAALRRKYPQYEHTPLFRDAVPTLLMIEPQRISSWTASAAGQAGAGVGVPVRVAFLCLGAMGAPMAGHLARAGHDVVVWNRTASRADAWVAEHGGRRASSPAAAAAGARFVLACTGADPDLRAITLGPDGAFAALAEGAVFVDHTTASPAIARELAGAAAARGASFLDAPVSGGQDGARRGALTVMVGGDPAALDRARPLLAAYAKNVTWLGPSGAGQLTKLANQICLAGLIQSLAEGLAFAARAGLDPRRVVEVISKGAAQSWQMDHRAETMIEGRFEFGFAVDWMRKDLALALAEAERCRLRLPAASLVDGLYAEVQRRGGGHLDSSSLLTLLRDA